MKRKGEMNAETPYTLCAEMLATLRANLLRGTITTQDDDAFDLMLHSWSRRLAVMKCLESRERIDAAVVELWSACKCASVPDSATLTSADLALFDAAARHPAVRDRLNQRTS